MTKEMKPVDLAQLAHNSRAFRMPAPGIPGDVGTETNTRLAAGLDRLRGQAVQRAKEANDRLLRLAFGATAISFGIGASLGFLMSRRRSC